jgi:hypothetical protein
MRILENIEILHKPVIRFNTVKILGRSYLETIFPPKIYILKGKYDIKNHEDVTFTVDIENGRIQHTLEDVYLNRDSNEKFEEQEMTFIECKKWKETYDEKIKEENGNK